MTKCNFTFITALLICLIFADKVNANENLNLSSINFVANEALVEQQIAEIILKQVYANINVAANVIPMPPSRASSMNLNLESDGEIARIYSYGVKFPQLIRVEPPYYSLTTTGFCLKEKNIEIKTKADLTKYSLAVIRGVAHTDAASEGHPNVMAIATGVQLYDLVLKGRADIALDSGINGRKFLAKKEYSGLKECGTIANLELYNYLNVKSAKYQKPVSEALTKLKSSGELKKMIQKAENEVLSKN